MCYKSPISIQFVWHPNDDEIVEPIVTYCKNKLSKNTKKPFLHSLDFPIFCYTSKDDNTMPSGLNNQSESSIAFIFIGDSIVSSDEWNAYIDKHMKLQEIKIVPIALSLNAHKIKTLSSINSLRYYDYRRKYDDDSMLIQCFFIEIAHEIYRWTLNLDENHKQLKLFLSHTKIDEYGLELAKTIKSFIDSDTTMDNFFDTNDIQTGSIFDEEIKKNIKESTLIVIHTDNYASRYWCQKEIIFAKTCHRPIISVDYIKEWEDRSFPLMCNYPNIRYSENILSILELALLETIRFYYSRKMLEIYKECGLLPKDATLFSTVPDSIEINKVIGKTIIYPEPEIYPDEIEIVANGKMLATPLSYNFVNLSRKHIGLSISDVTNEELTILGQDSSCLKSLSQMLVQKFLHNGACIVYGGDLRDDGFTKYILDEAEIVYHRTSEKDILIKDYLAAPIYNKQKKQFEKWSADYYDVCKMIKVDYPSDVNDAMKDGQCILPENYVFSRALSHMRETMISECDIRICAGGRILGYKGCMPGLLEEVSITIRQKKPLFLIGGFGGAVSKLCQLMLTKEMPTELSLDWQMKNNENYSELLKIYDDNKEEVDYSWLNNLDISNLNNGLSNEDNKRLFVTPFSDEVVYLISKGLRNISC